MSSHFNFQIQIPRETLEDFALNYLGAESLEGATMQDLAQLVRTAILSGLREELGEDVADNEVTVLPG